MFCLQTLIIIKVTQLPYCPKSAWFKQQDPYDLFFCSKVTILYCLMVGMKSCFVFVWKIFISERDWMSKMKTVIQHQTKCSLPQMLRQHWVMQTTQKQILLAKSFCKPVWHLVHVMPISWRQRMLTVTNIVQVILMAIPAVIKENVCLKSCTICNQSIILFYILR